MAAKIENYAGRGVYVPEGMNAAEIMAGARVLESRFDVPPFLSRSMVREVLAALREAKAVR